MHRYRNRHAQSSRSKRDVKVEVWILFFVFARFCAFRLALMHGPRAVRRCRLGSDAGRSASPYPASENGNASDHNAPPQPQPGPKKKGRPPKNKPKGTADVRVAFVVLVPLIFVVAPVPVASTTVADDGDALTNRKRVGGFCSFRFRYGSYVDWQWHRSRVHHYPPRRKMRRNRDCRVR
jgi:hypothetical protein